MADDSLDPRFDPKFQRGFDPSTAPARPAGERNPYAPRMAPPPPPAGADAAGTPAPAPAAGPATVTSSRPAPAPSPYAPPAPSAPASSPGAAPGARLGTRADPAADPGASWATGAVGSWATVDHEADGAATVIGPRDIRRNPFLWAVLAVGVLMVVAGIAVYRSLGDLLDDEGNVSTAANYLQLQFQIAASPIAIGVGIAAILAVGIVHGVEWQRRR